MQLNNGRVEREHFTTELMEAKFIKGVIQSEYFHATASAFRRIGGRVESPGRILVSPIKVGKTNDAKGLPLKFIHEIMLMIRTVGPLPPSYVFRQGDLMRCVHVLANRRCVPPGQHQLQLRVFDWPQHTELFLYFDHSSRLLAVNSLTTLVLPSP